MLKVLEIDKTKIEALIKQKQPLANQTAKSSHWFKLEQVGSFGVVEKLEIIKFETQSGKYLIASQNQNWLKFALVEFINDEFRQNERNSVHNYHVTETDFNLPNVDKCKNYLAKSFFKLIEFKLVHKSKQATSNVASFHFLLTFENSFIQDYNLKVDLARFVFVKESDTDSKSAVLINNSTEIHFDTLSTQTNANSISNAISVSNDFVFKATKKVVLSTNHHLIYQIFDFSKSHLVYKKPPCFQINVYKIKPTISVDEDSVFLNSYLNPADLMFHENRLDLIKSNDLLWLFKRELYLNCDTFFNSHLFNFLYESMKRARALNILNEENPAESLVFLKKMRVLVYFVSNYFEMTSLFDKSNLEVRDHVEECKEENESDEDEEENASENEADSSENSNSLNLTPNEANLQTDSSIIIKSPSYYRSVFRDLTLNIFKYYSLDLIFTAYKVGFESLSPKEKLLVAIQGDFATKKNFFYDLNIENVNKNYELKLTDVSAIEKWLLEEISCKLAVKSENLDEGDLPRNESLILVDLINSMVCDLCGKKIRIDLSLEVFNVRCESGHVMSRCQRTLLPLNNFRHSKCSWCCSTWNMLSVRDYPHFKHLNENFDFCLFCD